jgi:hypothetical protein
MNFKGKKMGGYTALELVFYIAFFAVFSIISINSVIVMTRSFKDMAAYSNIQDAGNILERISREARSSLSITSLSANDLVLATTDSSGNSKSVEFTLSGTNLELRENGTLTGNLNSAAIKVSSLSFTQIDTVKSQAIKVALGVQLTSDTTGQVYNFYDTVVLRGEY